MSARLRFDPRQERVHQRLGLLGEGPAAFYRDAVRLLNEDSVLESGAHFLAHCFREIESALRKVLLPLAPPEDTQPKRRRKDNGGGGDTHAREVARLVEAYGIHADRDAARVWNRIATEKELAKLAHRDALMPPRSLDDTYRNFWREWEDVLDAILDRFEARFGEHVLVLQSLASVEAPTADHLERLRNTVPNNHVTLSEFFSRIDGKWLPLLRDGGYFAYPPGPDVTRDDDYHPPWAASQLLVRLSKSADAGTRTLVGEIALETPETSNPSVNADLAVVACNADEATALQLAARLGPLLRGSHAFRLPGHLTDVALRLAAEGHAEAALGMLREFVTVDSSTGKLTVDAFELETALPRLLPPIFGARAPDAAAALCDSLDRMLRVRLRGDDATLADDAAGFRAAIEMSGQNDPNTEREAGILIDALRDGCVLALRERSELLPPLLDVLARRELLVFKRIAMHLLSLVPQAAPTELERTLLDRSELESRPLWHERRELERTGFRYLTADAQRRFLEQIQTGPDVDAYRESQRHWAGKFPSDEDVREYVRRWRREHLTMIADDLPPAARADYDEIVAEHGPATHPGFLSPIVRVWSGPRSPRSRADLAQRTPDEVVAWLKEWVPSPRLDGPFASREGLLRELKVIIADGPEPWARLAHGFGELHATYARALLEGLTDAIGRERPFAWGAVLDLCDQVLRHSVDGAATDDVAVERDEDVGWRWTRRAISDLLVRGLQDGPAAIPDTLLDRVSPLLLAVRQTPEPRYGPRAPMDEALNSIAGSTMQGLIIYATRRGRIARQAGGPTGFDAAPDVRAVLEECLSTTVAPPLGSRAMIGTYLAQLVTLDASWVRAHRGALFPKGEDRERRDAVWDAYFGHGNPAKLVFETLGDALDERVVEVVKEDQERRIKSLLNHLAPALWWGWLSPAEPGALRSFYEGASSKARAALVKHIGFSIFHAEAVDEVVLTRAQALWESRAAAMSEGDKTAAAVEAAPFGWWFSSGKFPDRWSLAELRRALSLAPRLDLSFAVAERLALAAASQPLEAIELLSGLVASDDLSHAGACRRGIRSTVLAVRASADSAAKQKAGELVGRLLAHGYQDFIDLV